MIYEVLAVEVFLIKISVCIISISLLYQRNDIQSVPDAIRRSKCPAKGVKLSPLWPTSGTSVDTQYTTIRNVAFHQFHRISPYIRTNMASKIVMTEHLKSMTPIGLTTFLKSHWFMGRFTKQTKDPTKHMTFLSPEHEQLLYCYIAFWYLESLDDITAMYPSNK
jgi:hypothetical protein